METPTQPHHAPSETIVPSETSREARKQAEANRRRQQRAIDKLHQRLIDLEKRIEAREAKVKLLEAEMSAPGFYADREASQPVVEQHQSLMWEVGDLIAQWEALQEHAAKLT